MVDTHCHLEVCEPPDGDLVARAREAGVARLVTVGMDGPSIERALATAAAHPEVWAIVGRHPHLSEAFSDTDLDEIRRAARDERVIAIGETGLDYYRDNSPREDQRRAFEAQVGLAAELGLPVVIHTREATADTFAVLAEHAGEMPVILHCFSTPERLGECVERGYHCSFAGNVTYPKATQLQAAARELPGELLLLETDSPFLSPQSARGKPNEPANVVRTAGVVSGLRGMTLAELDTLVEANAARVFGW